MGRKRLPRPRPAQVDADRETALSATIPREVLEELPENVRTSVLEAAAFTGPLPPPSMFGQYESVLKGGAERIMTMAEQEQSHRIHWETTALEASARDATRGQWLGFVVSIVCIASAVSLAMSGHELVAAILAGTSVVSLVGRFVEGRSSVKSNSDARDPPSK